MRRRSLVAGALAAGLLLVTACSRDAPKPSRAAERTEVLADVSRSVMLPVDASAYQFVSVGELVSASDAVVRATVVAVERGRLVGGPGAGGVVSRRVTLRIDELLAGDASSTVLVEEEGWLADGTPIVVNGVVPSRRGDAGIWFLDALADPDLPAYLVVNSQGRFLQQGASLHGGDQRDPLVRELQALAPDELAVLVRAIPGT